MSNKMTGVASVKPSCKTFNEELTEITFKCNGATKLFKLSSQDLEKLDVAWLNKEYAAWAGSQKKALINEKALLLNSVQKNDLLTNYMLTKRNMKLHFLNDKVTLSQWEPINISQGESIRGYEALHMIGRGGFSEVFLGREVSNGQFVAMKRCQKGKFTHASVEKTLILQERQNFLELRSPFLANLLGAFQTKTHYYFVNEYKPCGTLRQLIGNNRTLFEHEICHFICEILAAMEFIHKAGYVLRDLKSDNILLDENGHLYFCDMGLATKAPKEGEMLQEYCGTVEYMAPEQLFRKGYNYVADYYSLGIIAYELSEKLPPFCRRSREDNISRQVLKEVPVIKKERSAEFKDFVGALLKKDLRNRLGYEDGINEIINHPWLRNVGFEAYRKRTNSAPSTVLKLAKYYLRPSSSNSRQKVDNPCVKEEFAQLSGFTVEPQSEHVTEDIGEIEGDGRRAKVLIVPRLDAKIHWMSSRKGSEGASTDAKSPRRDSFECNDWDLELTESDLLPEVNNCLHLAPKRNAEILSKQMAQCQYKRSNLVFAE